jgi:hypothetical protein
MATLTLNLDERLIARAEELARARNMTVSEMVARLLSIMARAPLSAEELPPLTGKASGMLTPMSDDEVEAALEEHRTRKYGQ